MEDALFVSECGLDYISVLVPYSVTEYIVLGVCINYSMISVVMESRAYAVSIAVAEIPCLTCVGLAMYEDTSACGTKWGGIVVKWDIAVFPS